MRAPPQFTPFSVSLPRMPPRRERTGSGRIFSLNNNNNSSKKRHSRFALFLSFFLLISLSLSFSNCIVKSHDECCPLLTCTKLTDIPHLRMNFLFISRCLLLSHIFCLASSTLELIIDDERTRRSSLSSSSPLLSISKVERGS